MMFQAGIPRHLSFAKRTIAGAPAPACSTTVPDPPLDEVLARLVAGAHQRPCRDEAESERQPLALEPREHFGAHELLDRQVLVARAQILAEREDVAVHRPQVAHRLDDFVVRLAEPEHDAALGPHPATLVEVEDVERLAVGGAAIAHPRGQPPHHSPTLGQLASSQTVWRLSSRSVRLTCSYRPPPGMRTFSHSGLGCLGWRATPRSWTRDSPMRAAV